MTNNEEFARDNLKKMTEIIRTQFIDAAQAAAGRLAERCADELKVPDYIIEKDPAIRDDMRMAIVRGFVDALDKTWMGEK